MKNFSYYNTLSTMAFCLLIFGCKSNLLVLEDIVPRASQQDLEVSFTQTSLTDFALKLNLTYEVTNPYKKDLSIPDHAMGILINDKKMGLIAEQHSVSVPAKSSKILDYSFVLTSGMLKNLLGQNNKFTFHSSLEFDLSEYSNMLPNYQLSITENFDLESSDFKPLVNNLMQKKIGKYKVNIEKTTHIKIPAPPSISVSTQPLEINLLGTGISAINPNAIKNALIPFGDLLVNGELDGLKNPFIDAMVNATVTYPAPTLTHWNRTVDVKIVGQILQLLRPLDNQIDSKWASIKSLLYQEANLPVTEYFIDNFVVNYVDPDAKEKWEVFRGAYNDFKNTTLPDQIPGPNTRGFELAIPFNFTNNNSFPIQLPIFRSSVFVNGNEPFSMYVKPKNVNSVALNSPPAQMAEVPAKTTETLYVVFSFNMQAFNQGMYSLFMKNQFNPNVKGIMSYDFGYGPMYVGYDLMNMQMNYK